jgi:hypothetical protein
MNKDGVERGMKLSLTESEDSGLVLKKLCIVNNIHE